MLETSKAARELRDEIVKTGRELYVFDAYEMGARARKGKLGLPV